MNQLLLLEERIKDKIHQTKNNMHETHNRAYTDSRWTEIETLNLVLNEILVLSRKNRDFSAMTVIRNINLYIFYFQGLLPLW